MLADMSEARQNRVAQVLQQCSNVSVMAEVDRRISEVIQEGLRLLNELRETDLAPLARKMKKGAAQEQDYTESEGQIVAKVHRAYWIIADIEYFYPDLHDERTGPFLELLDLHSKVTEQADVRVILYAKTKADLFARGTLR